MTHHHLTDEQLSSHLDGEAADPGPPEEAVEAELAACDVCRRRLEAVRGARDLVRRPVVAPPASVRTAAVAAALDAVVAGDPDPTAVNVTALHPRRGRGPLVGAAAAVAVLVVGVGIALGVAHRSSPTASSATATLNHGTAKRSNPSAASPKSLSPATAEGVRALGSVSSVQTLRARVAPLLPSGYQSSVEGKVASGYAQGGTSATGSAPDKVNGTASSSSATATPAAARSACVTRARQSVGVDDSLVLVATATYAHIPAYVVVVGPPASSSTTTVPATVRVVVVARSGCRILERTTL